MKIIKIKYLVGLCLVLSSLWFSASATAQQADFHLDGYDPVSYFSETGPVMGVPKHSLYFNGFTYRFATAKNLQKFSENPDKYAPAYGGNCAFGMVHGRESTIDPTVYEIVDGRLFFMINPGTRKQWNRKADKNIRKGDANWDRYFGNIR